MYVRGNIGRGVIQISAKATCGDAHQKQRPKHFLPPDLRFMPHARLQRVGGAGFSKVTGATLMMRNAQSTVYLSKMNRGVHVLHMQDADRLTEPKFISYETDEMTIDNVMGAIAHAHQLGDDQQRHRSAMGRLLMGLQSSFEVPSHAQLEAFYEHKLDNKRFEVYPHPDLLNVDWSQSWVTGSSLDETGRAFIYANLLETVPAYPDQRVAVTIECDRNNVVFIRYSDWDGRLHTALRPILQIEKSKVQEMVNTWLLTGAQRTIHALGYDDNAKLDI